MNIREIGGPGVLGLVRPIEKSRRVEAAHEIRSRCSQLFRFAIAEGRQTSGQRWSQDFGPVVKVDQLVKEMIQNDETKEPLARFQSQGCA